MSSLPYGLHSFVDSSGFSPLTLQSVKETLPFPNPYHLLIGREIGLSENPPHPHPLVTLPSPPLPDAGTSTVNVKEHEIHFRTETEECVLHEDTAKSHLQSQVQSSVYFCLLLKNIYLNNNVIIL